MALPADQLPGAWTLAEWLIGIILGLLQTIFGYQIFRIGRLEDRKADKEDLAELVVEMKRQNDRADEARERLYGKLDETVREISNLAIAVGRLEGERRNGKSARP